MDRKGAFYSAAASALAAGALLALSIAVQAADVPRGCGGQPADPAKLELCLERLVEGGELVSGFGWRRHPMGGGGAHHDGIDVKAPRGTPVRAAWAGTVTRIGWGENFGRFVQIRHGDNLQTVYAHLARVPKTLAVGQGVTEHDVIGFVGSSGRSTGPHLHFEVHREGKPVDPTTGEARRPPKKARGARHLATSGQS